jgi:hypothetical protein
MSVFNLTISTFKKIKLNKIILLTLTSIYSTFKKIQNAGSRVAAPLKAVTKYLLYKVIRTHTQNGKYYTNIPTNICPCVVGSNLVWLERYLVMSLLNK